MSRVSFLPLYLLVLAALACSGSPTIPTTPQGGVASPPTATTAPLSASPTSPSAQPSFTPPPLPEGTRPPLAFTPQWTPQGKADAQQVIQDYARDVLGLQITVTTGGGRVKDLEIPVAYEDGVSYALNLAGVSYFGVWTDGMASVSMGSGSASGDFVTDIQEGSLGVFSIRVKQPLPADGAAALELIKATYPGLAALDFFPAEPTETGYVYSYSKADDYSISGGAINLKGVIITAGTTGGRRPGVTVVWVIVASGALSTPFE